MYISKVALGTLNTLDETGRITGLPYDWSECFTFEPTSDRTRDFPD